MVREKKDEDQPDLFRSGATDRKIIYEIVISAIITVLLCVIPVALASK